MFIFAIDNCDNVILSKAQLIIISSFEICRVFKDKCLIRVVNYFSEIIFIGMLSRRTNESFRPFVAVDIVSLGKSFKILRMRFLREVRFQADLHEILVTCHEMSANLCDGIVKFDHNFFKRNSYDNLLKIHLTSPPILV